MKKTLLLIALFVCALSYAQTPTPFKNGLKTPVITTDGFTTAQINAFTGMTNGELRYDTDLEKWKSYNGDSWEIIGSGGGTGADDQNASEVPLVTAINAQTDVQASLEDHETRIDALVSGGTFPGFTSLLADYGFTDNSTNWNTAFNRGDHPTLVSSFTNDSGYLINETDPIYSAWDKDYADLINTPNLTLKQDNIILTTTGTSGVATLVGSTLNVPNYTAGGATTINNTLTSTATDEALSAAQGKVLKDIQDTKQDLLVSGTNLKTINGESLLGSTNIVISGSGTSINTEYTQITYSASMSDAYTSAQPNRYVTMAGDGTLTITGTIVNGDNAKLKINGTGTITLTNGDASTLAVTVSGTPKLVFWDADENGNLVWYQDENDGVGGSISQYSALIGNGSLTTISVAHNLGTVDIASVLIREVSTGDVITPGSINIVDTNNINLVFSVAPITNGYDVTVTGGNTLLVTGGGAVDSVNTQTGAVVLDADDISDAATTNKFVTTTDITKLSNTSGTNTGDQDLSGKQDVITLTTTGTSGSATFVGNTLNVPQYTGGGTSIIVKSTTGGADYADTVYTTLSPFTLDVADGLVDLPNNAGTVYDTQKPTEIPSFYDGTKILGQDGNYYSLTIEFEVRPTSAAADIRLKTSIDIGGAVGEIYPRDFSLTKGNGVEHYYLSSFLYYSRDTFEANGGTIKIQALNGPVEIYNVRYVFALIHYAGDSSTPALTADQYAGITNATGATALNPFVTSNEVKTIYEANADTNAFTDAEKSNLATNTAKISYTDSAQVTQNTSDISTIQSEQTAQDAAIALNTAKTGITAQQTSDITTNNAKISYTDAAAVSANTAKVSYVAPTGLTGVAVDLDNAVGKYYNMSSANAGTTYTTSSLVIGGYAKCLINTTSEPTVTGATKIAGATWVTGTNMYLVIFSDDATTVKYYFLQI